MKKLLGLLLLIPALAFGQGQFGVGVTDLSTAAAPYKDGYFSGTVSTGTLIVSGSCTGCGTVLPNGSTAGQWLRWTGAAWGASTPTLANTAGAGLILRGDGTNWISSTATFPDTATSGAILRASGANTWANSTATFPDTATSGAILRASAANTWAISQSTYPDLVASGNVLYATAANTIGSSNNLTFNGTLLTVTGDFTVTGTCTGCGGGGNLTAPVVVDGTAPTMGACGTTPSVVGTDNAMFVTVGTGGAATSCAVTFNTTWTNAPICIAQSDTDIIAFKMVTTTTTATVTAAAPFTASSKLHVLCMGWT